MSANAKKKAARRIVWFDAGMKNARIKTRNPAMKSQRPRTTQPTRMPIASRWQNGLRRAARLRAGLETQQRRQLAIALAVAYVVFLLLGAISLLAHFFVGVVFCVALGVVLLVLTYVIARRTPPPN
jgi:hypothetical protein